MGNMGRKQMATIAKSNACPCCRHGLTKKQEKRSMRRTSKIEWKKEV